MWKVVEGESFQNKMYYIYTDEKLDLKKNLFLGANLEAGFAYPRNILLSTYMCQLNNFNLPTLEVCCSLEGQHH